MRRPIHFHFRKYQHKWDNSPLQILICDAWAGYAGGCAFWMRSAISWAVNFAAGLSDT